MGFLNPALYFIGNSANNTTAFHDTTLGDNTWPGSPNLFFAVPGYDLCTGWGTPNGTTLINMLTVVRPPWILTQPQSQTVIAGANVGFSVIARGAALLNYQWFFNGQPISAATGDSYSIASVQSSEAGTYTVVVSNFYGSVLSAPATLVVFPQAPTITTQPQSQTVAAGANVGFSVIARGTAPLLYQWFFNGQPIPASTGSSYSIARVQSSQIGTYTVVVSNSFGSVLSAPATLAIASGSGAFGIIGAPFSYQIVANNNPTWYSASGLPSGLSCDGATGLISGTPTRTGAFSVNVQARNIFGSTASATVLFTIANGAITSATRVQGVIGVLGSYQIIADNSPTAYSASGLPSGISCDVASGLISGTPTQTGTFGVNVQARNLFATASATISLTISDGTMGGASQPTLAVLRTGNSVLLTWPVTSDGYVLEETQLQPNAWTNSSAPVVVQGSNNVATITTAVSAKFYRLRK